MPKYSDATWGGQTRVLENKHMRVEVHNRSTGWAYVEFYTPEGKLMGVLPYLASVLDSNGGPRGNMATFRRVESTEVKEEHTEEEDALVFDVHALTFYEMMKGSFVEFMTPKEPPEMTGTIRLALPKHSNALKMEYDFYWNGRNGFAALHDPWLYAGANSFGLHKTDGILPGAEWLRTDEWSSNQKSMMPPLSDRTAIHPYKISAPLMAVSHEGDTISLSWDPLCPIIEKRPMQVEYYPQQVFSSPDAINHADQHLMGLMLPNVMMSHRENEPVPEHVTIFPHMTKIHFSAEIAVGKGTSVDALADYVKRHGLPEPPQPKKPLEEQLHYIAERYNTNFWVDRADKTGWGNITARDMIREDNSEPSVSNFHVPQVFLDRYIETYRGTELADALEEKLTKARAAHPDLAKENMRTHHGALKWEGIDRDTLIRYGEGILALQEADGSFLTHLEDERSATWQPVFINHWPMAEKIYKAMSWDNAVTVENNVVSALHLMKVTEYTGEQRFAEAAFRALDFALPLLVADGGDAWETPMEAPNLLATGHAAMAYELAYRLCGKEEYRKKAIYWLRGLLVFTHIWEPKRAHLLYNTKPCFCATDWATTSWVDAQVEWEVIEIFSQSREYGIDWGEVDPEIDWHRYEEGIACATTYWMLDSGRAGEIPLDIDLELGNLDGMFADQFDPVTQENLGWQLMPTDYANIIMNVLERKERS